MDKREKMQVNGKREREREDCRGRKRERGRKGR
jgi:hypothetical protein